MGFESTVFWVGAALLALGAGALAVRGARADERARKFHWVVALAAGIAAGAYAAMALGVSATTVATGDSEQVVYTLRYADWLVTTPLLLVVLWWLADSDARTLAALVALDAVMVLAGAAATLTTGVAGLDAGAARPGLAVVGALALLGLLAVLFRVLSPQAGRQPGDVGIVFSILRNLTAVLWLLYPTVWLVGPGLAVVGVGAATIGFAVLDILAKLGFGAILVHDEGTLGQA